MIKHNEARAIAEAMWGKGGTNSERTNARGAFWFSCSGHGGFIIADEAITDAQRDAMRKDGFEPETATRYIGWRKTVFMHPHRMRGARIAYHATETVTYWVFEEDCNWCMPALFCGIGTKSMTEDWKTTREHAERTYANWIKHRVFTREKENPS